MYKILFFLFFIFLYISQSLAQKNSVISDFKNPPKESQLHIWWHWMQGNITKEGITKDLEAMKANGISQATILNVGLIKNKDYGVKPVKFNSEEWHQMFAHALTEAQRLNIKIGAHNCDGWSASGGPWVTPQNAMKTLTWSKTMIEGGKNQTIMLKKPFINHNYYQNIAVIAIKDDKNPSQFQGSNPQFYKNDTLLPQSICDGSLTGGFLVKWGNEIKINLSRPLEVNKLGLALLKPFTWIDAQKVTMVFTLHTSNDGKSYAPHQDITITGYNRLDIQSFKNVKSKYFKLTLNSFPWEDSYFPLFVSEIELLKDDEKPLFENLIPNLLAKTSFVKGSGIYEYKTDSLNKIFSQTDVIDVTKHLSVENSLNYNLPSGKWTLIQIGYTASVAKNAPATAEGEGLECDKMDTSALNHHFNNYSQKLINTAGTLTGNTFKFLLIDSWECGFQNWTHTFATEFEQKRGYSLMSYLPILCGYPLKSAAETDAFLYDFRKTMAELIEQNYYAHFKKLCHQKGLELHAEVIYGGTLYPPLDVLKAYQHADMPMFEFWAGHNANSIPEYKLGRKPDFDITAAAALFYDKKLVGAEAYTSMAHYSETPYDLKPFGDQAYTNGINQFILHSYVHQPTDSLPGFTLGDFASHFNRNNTWFAQSKAWSLYHQRIQHYLQKGTIQAQVLSYMGDQLPLVFDNNLSFWPYYIKNLPINQDILINKLSVENNKLKFRNNQFEAIYLPKNISITYQTLLRINEMLEKGVLVIGTKPRLIFSMQDNESDKKAANAMLNTLWDEKNYIKNLIKSDDLQQNVGQLIPEAIKFNTPSDTLLYTHRATDKEDIFFVQNPKNKVNTSKMAFKTNKLYSYMLNPINGDVSTLLGIPKGDYFSVSPAFKAFQSVIILFTDEKIVDISNTIKIAHKPLEIQKMSVNLNLNSTKIQKNLNFDYLPDITQSYGSDVKYFSGTMEYSIVFTVGGLAQKKDNYSLNIGNIAAMASLTLNGVDLGQLWTPNEDLFIGNNIKNVNELKIKVATTWRNRIIGDYELYKSLKNIWTTHSNISNFLNEQKPLRFSGIEKIEINQQTKSQ